MFVVSRSSVSVDNWSKPSECRQPPLKPLLPRHPCATSKERRLGHALAIIPRYSKTNCVPSTAQKKAANLCVIYQSNYFFIAVPSNPWPDPSSRGSLKFGDKCEMTQQCGFAGSICYQSYCTCSHEFMSTNHVDKCGKGEKVAVMPQV